MGSTRASQTSRGTDTQGCEQAAILNAYKLLFDRIESQPLTQEQRIACISQAKATLVLAGAGTGKTSTLTGRVAYLLASHLAGNGKDILCLAFAREAATEIGQRLHARVGRQINVAGFRASTFHSLGLDIVSQVEGRAPPLSALAGDETALAAFIESRLLQLASQSEAYANLLYTYFSVVDTELALSYEFDSRAAYITASATRSIVALSGIQVRNAMECLVANALTLLDIAFSYRQHYEREQYLAPHRPYQCTFYLRQYRIYLDVFECPLRKADTALTKHAEKLRRIHDKFGTAYVQIWETAEYLREPVTLWNQLADMATSMASSGRLFGTSLERRLTTGNIERVGTVPACHGYLHARYLACIEALMPSAAWQQFQVYLARLLPLYRQGYSRADRGMREKSTSCDSAQDRRHQTVLALLAPLARDYAAHLRQQDQIDFDDMIQRATRYIRDGRFRVPWSDILIDEFQDISAARYALINAIRQAVPAIRLFCVGDDWQAIYRFAGSDITFSTRFDEYVDGNCNIVKLSRTFRFNQALCDISSQFLMRNPHQNRKALHAASITASPVITIMPQAMGLARIFAEIAQANNAGATVLVLARFTHLLPSEAELAMYQTAYPSLSVRSSTVHAAKGLEADYVFILHLDTGPYGFPSSKTSDCVVESLLPAQESFPHADERRLFYVALTRARRHVWLLVPERGASDFVTEVRRNSKMVINAANPWWPAWRAAQITIGVGSGGLVSGIAKRISARGLKLPLPGVIDEIKRYVIGLVRAAKK